VVGAGRRVEGRQGGIGIGVSQVGESVFFNERTFAGQALQHPLDDSRKDGLELLRRGCRYGLEDRDSVGQAIDAIKHQAMEVNIEIGGGACATSTAIFYKKGSAQLAKRWRKALQSRPTGGGVTRPQAAWVESPGGER